MIFYSREATQYYHGCIISMISVCHFQYQHIMTGLIWSWFQHNIHIYIYTHTHTHTHMIFHFFVKEVDSAAQKLDPNTTNTLGRNWETEWEPVFTVRHQYLTLLMERCLRQTTRAALLHSCLTLHKPPWCTTSQLVDVFKLHNPPSLPLFAPCCCCVSIVACWFSPSTNPASTRRLPQGT